jgi:hypothetical protein
MIFHVRTHVLLHESFCRKYIVTTPGSRNFLFLHLLYGNLILPLLIFLGLDIA